MQYLIGRLLRKRPTRRRWGSVICVRISSGWNSSSSFSCSKRGDEEMPWHERGEWQGYFTEGDSDMVTSHKEIMILLLGKTELCVYRVPPSKYIDLISYLCSLWCSWSYHSAFCIVLFPKTSSTTSVPETQIFTLPWTFMTELNQVILVPMKTASRQGCSELGDNTTIYVWIMKFGPCIMFLSTFEAQLTLSLLVFLLTLIFFLIDLFRGVFINNKSFCLIIFFFFGFLQKSSDILLAELYVIHRPSFGQRHVYWWVYWWVGLLFWFFVLH